MKVRKLIEALEKIDIKFPGVELGAQIYDDPLGHYSPSVLITVDPGSGRAQIFGVHPAKAHGFLGEMIANGAICDVESKDMPEP